MSNINPTANESLSSIASAILTFIPYGVSDKVKLHLFYSKNNEQPLGFHVTKFYNNGETVDMTPKGDSYISSLNHFKEVIEKHELSEVNLEVEHSASMLTNKMHWITTLTIDNLGNPKDSATYEYLSDNEELESLYTLAQSSIAALSNYRTDKGIRPAAFELELPVYVSDNAIGLGETVIYKGETPYRKLIESDAILSELEAKHIPNKIAKHFIAHLESGEHVVKTLVRRISLFNKKDSYIWVIRFTASNVEREYCFIEENGVLGEMPNKPSVEDEQIKSMLDTLILMASKIKPDAKELKFKSDYEDDYRKYSLSFDNSGLDYPITDKDEHALLINTCTMSARMAMYNYLAKVTGLFEEVSWEIDIQSIPDAKTNDTIWFMVLKTDTLNIRLCYKKLESTGELVRVSENELEYITGIK